jgi:GT2 family glycosyltransferase
MNKEIIYVCIPTTKERRKTLDNAIASIRENNFPHAIVIYENQDGGCAIATHNMIAGINGLVFILNDDMTIGKNCLELLYKTYKEKFPNNDGLIQPYDNFNKGKIAVSAFCHSDITKKYLHKGYKHKYSDTELTEVMKIKGKYLYLPEAEMYHHHETDKSKYDETYKIMDSSGAVDKELYLDRKAHNFYL